MLMNSGTLYMRAMAHHKESENTMEEDKRFCRFFIDGSSDTLKGIVKSVPAGNKVQNASAFIEELMFAAKRDNFSFSDLSEISIYCTAKSYFKLLNILGNVPIKLNISTSINPEKECNHTNGFMVLRR